MHIYKTASTAEQQDATKSFPIPLCFGRSSLEIKPQDMSEIGEHQQVFLTLEVDWATGFEGSQGTVRINCKGVQQAEMALAGYGATKLRMFPLQLDAGSKLGLSIEIDVIEPGPGVALNSPGAENEVARVVGVQMTPYDHKQDPRMAALRIASNTASQMGLSGVYMSPDRTELLLHEVSTALEDGRGYSFIRMGDGEGRVLGYPEFISSSEALGQVLNYHFGPISMRGISGNSGLGWILDTMKDLRALLTQSILAADHVGLPVHEYFKAIETGFVTGHLGYAAALNGYVALKGKALDGPQYGTNTFQQLARQDGFFAPVAKSAKELCILGPWDISSELQYALDLNEISYVPVQRHYSWTDPKTYGQYPIHYKVTMSNLRDMGDLRGKLFFVGAGLLGKSYCTQIKSQGGVALDIGSVFDAWARRGRPDAVAQSKNITFDKLKAKDPS